MEQNWVEINSGKLSQLEMFTMEEPGEGCDYCHFQEETGHVTGLYSAAKDEKDYWMVENLRTEATGHLPLHLLPKLRQVQR
jgi:hypothetical protein